MRLGLVGTGRWAQTMHGAAAAAHPGVELAGVWGRDPAKAADVAAALGTAPAASFEALLDRVDAVAFAVPPGVQAPLALQAARAGKHLLLEKPVALTVPEADELHAAAADVAAVVFLTRLWSPRSSAWLTDLAAQGGWTSGRAVQVAALGATVLPGSPWRAESGALWDVGPHALSALEAVLGRVVDVQAVRGVGDHVLLALRHETGAASTAELSLTATPAAAHTTAGFWGEHGVSDPLPPIAPDDMPAEKQAAATAALTGLLELAAGVRTEVTASLEYGVHQVRVLTAAQQRLAA